MLLDPGSALYPSSELTLSHTLRCRLTSKGSMWGLREAGAFPSHLAWGQAARPSRPAGDHQADGTARRACCCGCSWDTHSGTSPPGWAHPIPLPSPTPWTEAWGDASTCRGGHRTQEPAWTPCPAAGPKARSSSVRVSRVGEPRAERLPWQACGSVDPRRDLGQRRAVLPPCLALFRARENWLVNSIF